MNILTISSAYPYKSSNDFVFVKQLMDKFVTLNEKVIVIAPQSLTKACIRRKEKRPYKHIVSVGNQSYLLYSPKFLSFSNISILKDVASWLFRRSVLKTIKKEKILFDIIYAHFLSGPGTTAYIIHKTYQKPYFIAFGESTFNFKKNKLIEDTLKHASGFITVSSEMKNRLLSMDNTIDTKKISVHSNGYNPSLFYPIDKSKLRERFNLNDQDFVVVFVGGFIDRKGTLRLDEALKQINNPNIKAIFIGQGPEIPNYDHIVHKGPLPHHLINVYLNVSDVFVLPTLNEGSCNAIVEALGAGLPIISSNKTFNDDILNEEYAIKVDSNSIFEIKAAILKLYSDRKRLVKMAESAMSTSRNYHLEKRASSILEFIHKILK